MSTLLPYPKFKAVDASGVPLSGGKVYTYRAGTTTAKAAFTDRALTAPAANPVVLDSNGEAAIYLAGTYKIILKTSADVTVWTLDGVQGMGDWEGAYSYADYNEVDQGAVGTGSSIKDLVDAIGSEEGTICLTHNSGGTTTSYTLTTSLTIPSNIKLVIQKGAKIVQGGTATLTQNGPFEAGLYQVFSGFSIGNITGLMEARPEWFVFNTTPGTTDMTTAIGSAIAAAPRLILKDSSTYLLTAEVNGVSNLIVEGNNATIKATTRIRSYLYFSAKTNIKVRDVKFDHGKTSVAVYTEYPTVYNAALYFTGCSEIEVTGCQFSNLYTMSIYTYNCTGNVHIQKSLFTSPSQTQQLMLEFIYAQTFNGTLNITDNEFTHATVTTTTSNPCAFETSGTQGLINFSNNRVNYCGRDNTGTHRLGAIDFYGNHENVHVIGNQFKNVMAQAFRLAAVEGAYIHDNYFETNANAESPQQIISVEGTATFFGTGVTGANNVNIYDNTFVSGTAAGIGISATGNDYATPLKQIKIHHNSFKNFQQAYNQAGPYENVSFHHNEIIGTNGGIVTATIGTATATNGVAEADSRYDNLSITDNKFRLTNSGAYAPINVDFTKAPDFAGTIGVIDVSGNKARSTTQGSGIGIAVDCDTGTDGRLTVRNNDVDNYTTGYLLRNCTEVTFEHNRGTNIATTDLTQTGNGSFNQFGNRWGTGASSGRVDLSGGSATVSTNEVVTGDNILLTRVVTGGTQGTLTIGTIVNKTSFVITSSNGADTSTIFWQIVH